MNNSRRLQKNNLAFLKSKLPEAVIYLSCISEAPEWNHDRGTWLRSLMVLLIPSRQIPDSTPHVTLRPLLSLI
jgi:hypothetical protein